MVVKMEALVAEMQRLLGVYGGNSQRMARLNSKRIGLLTHLIEFTGNEPAPVEQSSGEAVGKSFDELEKEKVAGENKKKTPVKKKEKSSNDDKKSDRQEVEEKAEKKEEPDQEEKQD